MDQNDVLLPQPATPLDTVKGVTGFTVVPQQQPHSQLPVVAQASALNPLQVNVPLSELSHPLVFSVGVVVLSFYFQVTMWLTFLSPSGGLTIGACIVAVFWSISLEGI